MDEENRKQEPLTPEEGLRLPREKRKEELKELLELVALSRRRRFFKNVLTLLGLAALVGMIIAEPAYLRAGLFFLYFALSVVTAEI